METRTLYCSGCDRLVEVAYPAPPDGSRNTSGVDPNGVCLEYCSNACTGALCSLFNLPPLEMRVRLREMLSKG